LRDYQDLSNPSVYLTRRKGQTNGQCTFHHYKEVKKLELNV